MALAIDRAVLVDSGWRNILRQIPSNALLYLPGLEGGGTVMTDYSGNARNATVSGATWGQLAGGPHFNIYDGVDDFLWVPDNAVFDLTTKGTVFCLEYIDPADAKLDGLTVALMSKSDRAQAQGGWYLSWDDRGASPLLNCARFAMLKAADDGTAQSSENSLSPAGWYFLCGTFNNASGDAEEVKLYINGVKDGVANWANTADTNAFTVKLGANDDNAGGEKEHFYGRGTFYGILSEDLSGDQVGDINQRVQHLIRNWSLV